MENKIALSIDIEDWYHTPLFVGVPDSRYVTMDRFYREYKGRFDYITSATRNLLEILEDYKIRATFFVVADICFHYPELVKMLAESPHEIACHGRYHYPKYDPINNTQYVSNKEFESWTRDARKILEDSFLKEVIGYRAPIGYINLEMLQIIKSIGFQYDTSISANSMYKKSDLNAESLTTCPSYIEFQNPADGISDKILELPWTYLKLFKYRIPTAGAFFLRALGPGIISMGLKQALKAGDTMLYFHSMDLCREDFPVKSTNGRLFYWFRKGVRTAKMLKSLFAKFEGKFTTCEEVYTRNI